MLQLSFIPRQLKMKLRRWIAYPLLVLFCEWSFAQPIFAQQIPDKFGLKLRIESGDAASTTVKLPSSDPLVVVVVDANTQPVPGALVVFTAPDQGSGGTFENG